MGGAIFSGGRGMVRGAGLCVLVVAMLSLVFGPVGGAAAAPLGQITEFTNGLNSPYSFPNGISAGADGNLSFSDAYTPAIGRITLGGTVTEFSNNLNPGAAPVFLAAGADANVWFTD